MFPRGTLATGDNEPYHFSRFGVRAKIPPPCKQKASQLSDWTSASGSINQDRGEGEEMEAKAAAAATTSTSSQEETTFLDIARQNSSQIGH